MHIVVVLALRPELWHDNRFAGEYSCLKVDLLFKREFSYYLIQIYIPCCMLVIVSWVSFWLDQGAVPARVSLGMYSRSLSVCLQHCHPTHYAPQVWRLCWPWRRRRLALTLLCHPSRTQKPSMCGLACVWRLCSAHCLSLRSSTTHHVQVWVVF